jgi:cation:H+ antiporter
MALTLLLILGLGVLLGGAKLFVDGAVGIARAFGMSDRMIGLTIVAFGTAVPDLAASLVAALRGHSELAIGNVVGSNVFNLLLILGATSALFPIAGSLTEVNVDIAVMGLLTLVLLIALRAQRTILRWEGALMLASYVVFVAWVVLQRGS